MDKTTTERLKLIEAVSGMPTKVLQKFASFLDYLRYKLSYLKEIDTNGSGFLRAVASTVNSGQQDVSERDEEILRSEIDPVYAWNFSR